MYGRRNNFLHSCKDEEKKKTFHHFLCECSACMGKIHSALSKHQLSDLGEIDKKI